MVRCFFLNEEVVLCEELFSLKVHFNVQVYEKTTRGRVDEGWWEKRAGITCRAISPPSHFSASLSLFSALFLYMFLYMMIYMSSIARSRSFGEPLAHLLPDWFAVPADELQVVMKRI